ncbi:hypothetical protein OO185_00990 [Prosthecochloris sp. SCSIO W1102]|nr:hypothetical protein [Prosthecochloris sp. SCSIO W1102]UZJ39699.1 hypothetical protein OO185_00990 [Prosthecochloris sp. SCSIO W1102]
MMLKRETCVPLLNDDRMNSATFTLHLPVSTGYHTQFSGNVSS